jgi:hypothetical protein
MIWAVALSAVKLIPYGLNAGILRSMEFGV